MALPFALPTPRAAICALTAGLAMAGCDGIGDNIDYAVNHRAGANPPTPASADATDGAKCNSRVQQVATPGGWYILDHDRRYAHLAAAQGHCLGTSGAVMSDLNQHHAPALAYRHDALRYWPSRSLDSYRLDALPHPIQNPPEDWNDQPEGRALTRQMQGLIRAYERRQVICKAAAEPGDSGAADLCSNSLAVGLENRLLKAVRGDHEALRDLTRYVDAFGVASQATTGGFASQPAGLSGQRLWAQVGGDLALYKLSVATYLLLPGAADVQDGEEIVWAGAAALAADANGLLAHDKQLVALRQARPSIARGSWERAVALGATLSFQRRLGAELSVATYNYGRAPARLTVTGLPAGARLQALHPRAAAPLLADAQGRASVPLAAQSFAIWQVLSAGMR